MSEQVGSARVVIQPDTREFDTDLAKQVERSTRTLDRIVRGGEGIGHRLGTAIGTGVKLGLATIGATITGFLGASVAKGFQRFADIEDATASLTITLGGAAAAGDLLAEVLKVVEGTPFNLDQFASAARQLVAFGARAEKVPGILRAVGEAAASSGEGAAAVERINIALGQTFALGRLTGDTVFSLSAAGVPALQILANQFDTTTEKMQKMISAGLVPAEKGVEALVDGIMNGTEGAAGATKALEGSMASLGSTARGALGRVGAATARFGARVLTVFDKAGEGGHGLSAIFNDVATTIDVVGKAVERVAQRLVGSRLLARIEDFFGGMPGVVEKALVGIENAGSLSEALDIVFGNVNFGTLVGGLLGGLLDRLEALPHERIAEVLTGLLVRGLTGIVDHVPEIVRVIVEVAPAIIRGIAEGLIQAAREEPLNTALLLTAMGLPGIGPALTGGLTAAVSHLPFGAIMAPMTRGLGRAAQFAFRATRLGPAFAILSDKLALGFVQLALGMETMGAALAGALTATLVVAAGAALGVLIHNLIERVAPEFNRALEDVGASLFDFFADLPQRFSDFIGSLTWGRVGEVLGRVLTDSLIGVPLRVVGVIRRWGPSILQAGVDAFASFLDFIGSLPGRVSTAFQGLGAAMYDAAVRAWQSFLNGTVVGFHALVEWFRGLPQRIVNTFNGLMDALYELGRNAIQSLINGAKAIVTDSAWGRFWQGVGAGAYDFVADQLQAHSPSRVFMGLGRDVIDGLVLGLEGNRKALESSIGSILDFVEKAPARDVRHFLDSLPDKVRQGLISQIPVELLHKFRGTGNRLGPSEVTGTRGEKIADPLEQILGFFNNVTPDARRRLLSQDPLGILSLFRGLDVLPKVGEQSSLDPKKFKDPTGLEQLVAFINSMDDVLRGIVFKKFGPQIQGLLGDSGFRVAEDFSIVKPGFFKGAGGREGQTNHITINEVGDATLTAERVIARMAAE